MPVLETRAPVSLKNILFTTDFSASSDVAFPYARALAKRYGSTIYLAHVIAPEPKYEVPLDPLPVELEAHHQAAERRMAAFLELHPLKNIPYKTLMQAGELWQVLSSFIEKFEIELIVAGTHGREGLKMLVMGSAAEEIFRHAPCPVLTVGPHVTDGYLAEAGFRHILYTTNFSPASEHALQYALSLANEHRAALTMLHVVEEPNLDVAVPYPEAEKVRTRKRMMEALHADTPLWCTPEAVVEVGNAAEIILEEAEQKKADLIVMGAHHLSGFHRAHAPWRVAHQVVCGAHCPVMTVRD